jgi:hypothetical protein
MDKYTKAALDALTELLRKPDSTIRIAAARSILEFRGGPFGAAPQEDKARKTSGKTKTRRR